MKKKFNIKELIPWNKKEIDIMNNMSKIFIRDHGNDWIFGKDSEGRECFILDSIFLEKTKIYKTGEDNYTVFDIGDENITSSIMVCNLHKLITSLLNLYCAAEDNEDWEVFADRQISN